MPHPRETPTAVESRVSDVFIDAPGGRLFARTWGEPLEETPRTPILLIHDSLGSVGVWRDFPARLAATTGCTVVAYDRLGFGQSDPHPGLLETPGFVRDEALVGLPAILTGLGIDRVILFGHSVGGAMALVAAAEMSGEVAGVITEAAQVFAEELTLTSIRAAQQAFADPAQFARVVRFHGDKASWVLNAWTHSWLAPEFATWTIEDDLRRVRCPILSMHGDRDEYGSRTHPERIAALVPTPADIVLFDDCGHVPHRDRPEEVLAAATTFLDARLPA